MRMIVGLGNPGREYANTRHNAGFMVIDALCAKLGLQLEDKKFNGIYGVYRHNGEKILILKPQTYMNLSGEAVLAFKNYYDIDEEDIIVVHDDLDLPIGKLRLRAQGSSGGQKGMQNIIDLLHTQKLKRIRVGISKNDKIDVKDYVLGKIEKENLDEFNASVNKAADAIICSFDEPFNVVMNRFN